MELTTEAFSLEGGTLPVPMDSAVAHTMPGTTTTLVAGSGAMLSHVVGSSEWTSVAPPPVPGALSMGDQDDLVWLAGRNNFFYFYDAATDAWSPTLTLAAPGMLAAVTANGGTYALAQDGTSIEGWRLEKSLLPKQLRRAQSAFRDWC